MLRLLEMMHSMRLVKSLKRVTGISTPLGGVSWDSSTALSIPKFTQPIYLTGGDNGHFVTFLKANDRRLIALNLSLDASIGTEQQHEYVAGKKTVFEQIHSCKLHDLAIPLPCRDHHIVYLKLHFCDPHHQVYSSGGTGVFVLPVRGVFEVVATHHGGPSIIFHLKEVVAPIDVQVSVFGD
jgi:hypothetical protein